MDDPNGQDDILVDDSELHLPLGQPVQALLRSIDVLHDFYVPQFRAKMDMVPGMITFFWLTPTRTGTFDILCFELCGIGHHEMRGTVVVEAPEDFEAWLGGGRPGRRGRGRRGRARSQSEMNYANRRATPALE